jgi:hypothetical protein
MIRKYINQNMIAHAWNIRLSFSLFFLSLCNVISGHIQLRKKVNIRAIIILSDISLSKLHSIFKISKTDSANRIKWDRGNAFKALFQFQKILLIFIIYCLYIKLL